jgi:hypothetical protein
VDARSDRILGFTMFGPEAGEVTAAVQTAMLAGMPYTGLRDAVLAHPTRLRVSWPAGKDDMRAGTRPARPWTRPPLQWLSVAGDTPCGRIG